MLPKKNRLSRLEIEELKSKKGNIFQGKFFGLIYRKTDEPGKFGLIISNKVVSQAVERNKIKRRLYLAAARLLDKKGQFLFLAKKESVKGSLEEFKEETEAFMVKIIGK